MNTLGGNRIFRIRALVAVGFLAVAWAFALAYGGCGGDPVPAVEGRVGAFPRLPPSTTTTIWAVGDADGSHASRRVARLVTRGAPTRLLYLGDIYDSGTAKEFRTNYAFGGLKERTLPTPGNHEWPRHRTGYDPYWATVTGGRPPTFYALRTAGWQLLSLNSQEPHGAGSSQLRWLHRNVRRKGNCRLAFWHRPYKSASHHGDQSDVAPLWNALRGRAVLVLNGHEHAMQQLRPQEGITALVSGAGGHGRLYPVNRRDRRLAWANDREPGALRVDLRPGRASFAFVAAGGRVLRRGSVRCRTH